MHLSLHLKLDNAAMQDEAHVAAVLRFAAQRVEQGFTNCLLRDENGNTVGSFEVEED